MASSSSCAWHKRLPKRARCPRSLAQRGRLPDGLKSGWIFRAKRRGGQSPFLNQHWVAGLITAGDATMFWADGAAIGGIVLSQVALLTALLAWTAIKSIAEASNPIRAACLLPPQIFKPKHPPREPAS